MLKASALYLVIIIALVIAVICSSMIVAAYFYKIQYQKNSRYDQLENNLSSVINILINSSDTAYLKEKTFSLFDNETDSVQLRKQPWGIYDVYIAKAFNQKDTLYKIFSVANNIDSAKWAALYLKDKDRPFSVSGKTTIRGDAYIPKAGVTEAEIGNKVYEGDKRLIIGKINTSERHLPLLNEVRLKILSQYFPLNADETKEFLNKDSINESFLKFSRIINFGKSPQTLASIKITGNVVLYSDTTINIDSTSVLNNILVIAKSITVNSGFNGSCQLFAIDSIHISANCNFNYPSCLGILRFNNIKNRSQSCISIGNKCNFNGTIFTYEKFENQAKSLISIGKNSKVKGQVYSQGILELKDNAEIDGSVFTSQFLYKNGLTLYENYLINATIDSKMLSAYYLTSDLLPVSKAKKKILQWLESN